jgi:hypothetical protein
MMNKTLERCQPRFGSCFADFGRSAEHRSADFTGVSSGAMLRAPQFGLETVCSQVEQFADESQLPQRLKQHQRHAVG